MKMRFLGLGTQVTQNLGVSTQLLVPADIYPALERDVIDATEFAMPNMDIDLGFHQSPSTITIQAGISRYRSASS
jgi:TRAP-type mannitol/chloroaromatic compound transport system substrate-binding protein